jgi:hypothetical protein
MVTQCTESAAHMLIVCSTNAGIGVPVYNTSVAAVITFLTKAYILGAWNLSFVFYEYWCYDLIVSKET